MLTEIDKITSKISWTGYDLGHQSIEDNWSRIKQVMKEQSDWSWEEPQAIYVPKQFNNRKLFDVPVHLWYNLNSTNYCKSLLNNV